MAWIKVEVQLPDKPEVAAIAEQLSIDPDAVVGKLVRVWTWYDQHTTDGEVSLASKAFVDRLAYQKKFGDAMQSVGWLEKSPSGGWKIPNFDKHNGESGKARAQGANRAAKSRHRNATSNADSNGEVTHDSATGASREPSQDAHLESESESESESELDSESEERKKTQNYGSDHKDNSSSKEHRAAPIVALATQEELLAAKPLAADLFSRMRYQGNDGSIVWQAAILVGRSCGISEAMVHSAANAVKLNAKKSPLGYFRTTLAESCPRLDELLVSVGLPSGFDCGPPEATKSIGDLLRNTIPTQ